MGLARPQKFILRAEMVAVVLNFMFLLRDKNCSRSTACCVALMIEFFCSDALER